MIISLYVLFLVLPGQRIASALAETRAFCTRFSFRETQTVTADSLCQFSFFPVTQPVLMHIMHLLSGMEDRKTGLFRGMRRLQAGIVVLIFG